jgi:hypothetical protein
MFQNLHRTMNGSDQLKIQCVPCQHLATWVHAEATRSCGPDATPMEIRARARCTACGRLGQVRVWI